jgi:hypothetical protein
LRVEIGGSQHVQQHRRAGMTLEATPTKTQSNDVRERNKDRGK